MLTLVEIFLLLPIMLPPFLFQLLRNGHTIISGIIRNMQFRVYYLLVLNTIALYINSKSDSFSVLIITKCLSFFIFGFLYYGFSDFSLRSVLDWFISLTSTRLHFSPADIFFFMGGYYLKCAAYFLANWLDILYTCKQLWKMSRRRYPWKY